MSNDELASTYASLALHDAGLAVTADKINAMAKKAGVDVAAFWPNFFERVLKTQSLDDIILNAGSVSAPAPQTNTNVPTTDTTKPVAPVAEKPVEKPKEPSSEEPDDGGLLDFF